ncbi:hypothetical protein [Pantoea sp. 18069]|uniref:hypothetical protein n=1 Tax=Pantoea sp. 18069 TaxID=2681415 RepID=UPI001358F01D|nr:hypothetical protein [Pantoea sp. 18069]
MQFALQALPFSRHAQNDMLFGHLTAAPGAVNRRPSPSAPSTLHSARPASVARLPLCPPAARGGVRILRNEAQSEGGRLLISGRMADVCAALNRLAFNEYACG